MKKFILSSVLMLGLTFAANANTAEVPAPIVRVPLDSDLVDAQLWPCATQVAVLVDYLGFDVSTVFGFQTYQYLVEQCEQHWIIKTD